MLQNAYWGSWTWWECSVRWDNIFHADWNFSHRTSKVLVTCRPIWIPTFDQLSIAVREASGCSASDLCSPQEDISHNQRVRDLKWNIQAKRCKNNRPCWNSRWITSNLGWLFRHFCFELLIYTTENLEFWQTNEVFHKRTLSIASWDGRKKSDLTVCGVVIILSGSNHCGPH